MKIKGLFFIAAFLLVALFYGVAEARDTTTDVAVLTNFSGEGWVVDADGNLLPTTDDSYTIGTSSLSASGVCIAGVCKTSWGSIVSPMTDTSTYVNPTDAGNYVRLYDAGYLRLGDATNAGDYYTLYSSDAGSWYAGHDDTSNVYVIGYGTSVGTDVRLKIKFDANDSEVTIGDGTAGYDKYIVFEGASTADYYVGIDDTGGDSEDLFVIGTGSTVGTSVAMSVDSSGVVAVTAGLDAIGAADMDYGSADVTDHTFTTDSTGDAEIVLPNDSIGDGEIDWSGLIASHPFEINGTIPSLTVGDGGTEDNTVVFDGVTDFTMGVDHTRSKFEITNGADLDQTCAISIDANEDVTIDSGSLYIVDDEYVILGTNSDWKVEYDEAVDNQLIFLTAATTATATTDPLYEIIVGASPTANQQVFGVAKGTQVSNTPLLTLDEDGDLIVAGTSTLTGDVTLTGDIDIDGDGLTTNGDLLITPGGTEVHIDGGLAVGDTTAVGDNNAKIVGTLAQVGVATFTAQPILNAGADINEDIDVDLDANDEEISVVSTAGDYAAGSGIVTVYDDSTGQTNASYLVRLAREANGDAQDHFILCEDNSTGAAADGDDMFAVNSGGDMTVAGTSTLTGGYKVAVISTTDAGTYSVLATNSGKIHAVPDLTADCTFSLPTEASGLNYKFVYAGAAQDAQDWIIQSTANGNPYKGGCTDFDDDDGTFGVVYANGSSNSQVSILTPNAGTSIELWCDGTNWILNGQVVSGTDTATVFADQ